MVSIVGQDSAVAKRITHRVEYYERFCGRDAISQEALTGLSVVEK